MNPNDFCYNGYWAILSMASFFLSSDSILLGLMNLSLTDDFLKVELAKNSSAKEEVLTLCLNSLISYWSLKYLSLIYPGLPSLSSLPVILNFEFFFSDDSIMLLVTPPLDLLMLSL